MHPALSVIFFTTLSGAGLALLMLLAALQLSTTLVVDSPRAAALHAVALVLLTIGLLSSTLHLGKPLRAWRAFSQWRSSWLSREGIASLLAFAAAVASVAASFANQRAAVVVLAAATFAAAAFATLCTSRIYDTLKAIPAWYDGLVLPNYVLIGLVPGLGWLAVLWPLSFMHDVGATDVERVAMAALAVSLIAAAAFKLAYWRRIDTKALPTSTGSLTGLERLGDVRAFEAPHTETNYLLREMGFVLARKHAKKLRGIAFASLYVVPFVLALAWLFVPPLQHSLVVAVVALLAMHAGAFVERWLFFAEAKHVVTLYYPGR